MRIRNVFSRAAGWLLCLILALSSFAIPVLAYGKLDTAQTASLDIQYPCSDTEFRLYRVAEVSEFGAYALTGDFAGYNISLDQPDQSGWRALAETLSGYVARDQRSPAQSGTTDAQGGLRFSDLPVGLYLVIGDKHERDDMYYVSEPMLIALPNLDAGDRWVYDVASTPKYTTEPIQHTSDLEVVKVWKDGDNAKRPTQITAQLLRDGSVWDSVVLSEKNSWRHTWEALDHRYTWQVVEESVPQGYTVTTQTDKNTVILTNTKPNVPAPVTPAKLPQTGVLWWPVGVLAAAGILMLLLGCIRRKSKHA